MSNFVSSFEKVSFNQFLSCFPNMNEQDVRNIYDQIQLPRRGTNQSAGYDFSLPVPICLTPGSSVIVPTGIRAKINPGWFLMCVPRSGLGFKYGVRLKNTVGIIDSDYYSADNEGHIMAALTSDIPISLNANTRFMQGIFLPFGITMDDSASGIRTGGLGSTGLQ